MELILGHSIRKASKRQVPIEDAKPIEIGNQGVEITNDVQKSAQRNNGQTTSDRDTSELGVFIPQTTKPASAMVFQTTKPSQEAVGGRRNMVGDLEDSPGEQMKPSQESDDEVNSDATRNQPVNGAEIPIDQHPNNLKATPKDAPQPESDVELQIQDPEIAIPVGVETHVASKVFDRMPKGFVADLDEKQGASSECVMDSSLQEQFTVNSKPVEVVDCDAPEKVVMSVESTELLHGASTIGNGTGNSSQETSDQRHLMALIEDGQKVANAHKVFDKMPNMTSAVLLQQFVTTVNANYEIEKPTLPKEPKEQSRASSTPTRGRFQQWLEKETELDPINVASPDASLIDKRHGLGNWHTTMAYSSVPDFDCFKEASCKMTRPAISWRKLKEAIWKPGASSCSSLDVEQIQFSGTRLKVIPFSVLAEFAASDVVAYRKLGELEYPFHCIEEGLDNLKVNSIEFLAISSAHSMVNAMPNSVFTAWDSSVQLHNVHTRENWIFDPGELTTPRLIPEVGLEHHGISTGRVVEAVTNGQPDMSLTNSGNCRSDPSLISSESSELRSKIVSYDSFMEELQKSVDRDWFWCSFEVLQRSIVVKRLLVQWAALTSVMFVDSPINNLVVRPSCMGMASSFSATGNNKSIEDILTEAPVHILTGPSQLPPDILSRDRALCIMQIASQDVVYIIDASECGDILMHACKPVLESESVIQVIHVLYLPVFESSKFGIWVMKCNDYFVAGGVKEFQNGLTVESDVRRGSVVWLHTHWVSICEGLLRVTNEFDDSQFADAILSAHKVFDKVPFSHSDSSIQLSAAQLLLGNCIFDLGIAEALHYIWDSYFFSGFTP